MVILAVAFWVTSAQAQPTETGIASQTVLVERIQDHITRANLGEQLAVSVVNLRSGRAIVSHNSAAPLNPASNMKLITAAAALVELGPQFRMRTGLYGRQQGDAVVGGLHFKSFGDPTLDNAAVIDLAGQLVARGIRKVDEVIVDGSYFDHEVLPPAFDQQPDEISPFRSAVAAVSVDANAYTLRVRPGPEPGAPARVALDGEGYFSVTNALTTVASGAPTIVAVQATRDDKLTLRLSGEVPLGITVTSYRRRVESPLHFAGHKLIDALRAQRVQVPVRVRLATTPGGAALLASRVSPPLSNVLYALGKESDNFTAEMLLKVMSAERTRKPGSSASGARIALEVLTRLGVTTAKLEMVNGSGLFAGNKVSASQLTSLLQAMHADPALRPEFLAHLAVGGVDGTLERRFLQLPAPRIVRAKTGTLNDVITLSGYVVGPDRDIAFSVLANGMRGKQHVARSLADAIVNEIATHLHPGAERPQP